ncbi:hypothetical protein B0H16DRAFT_1746904 [Mycena metata]|uniref:Uncharacterized protein n=1 Tax=Mycena metata TaxID=1033252 RepID=A0AAD7GW58_9AGAR|nr:hypothetical protein B0H16DRAFT_1746904 [Mycena metata]
MRRRRYPAHPGECASGCVCVCARHWRSYAPTGRRRRAAIMPLSCVCAPRAFLARDASLRLAVIPLRGMAACGLQLSYTVGKPVVRGGGGSWTPLPMYALGGRNFRLRVAVAVEEPAAGTVGGRGARWSAQKHPPSSGAGLGLGLRVAVAVHPEGMCVSIRPAGVRVGLRGYLPPLRCETPSTQGECRPRVWMFSCTGVGVVEHSKTFAPGRAESARCCRRRRRRFVFRFVFLLFIWVLSFAWGVGVDLFHRYALPFPFEAGELHYGVYNARASTATTVAFLEREKNDVDSTSPRMDDRPAQRAVKEEKQSTSGKSQDKRGLAKSTNYRTSADVLRDAAESSGKHRGQLSKRRRAIATRKTRVGGLAKVKPSFVVSWHRDRPNGKESDRRARTPRWRTTSAATRQRVSSFPSDGSPRRKHDKKIKHSRREGSTSTSTTAERGRPTNEAPGDEKRLCKTSDVL